MKKKVNEKVMYIDFKYRIGFLSIGRKSGAPYWAWLLLDICRQCLIDEK